MAGEAAHVHFVDDRPCGEVLQGGIGFPVVGGRIRHHALHSGSGIVAGQAGSLTAVVRRHHYGAAIGVEQHFGGVEPHASRRVKRPMHTIAIDLPGLYARHENMPVVVGSVDGRVQFDDPARVAIVRAIEEQQLHLQGGAGVQAEVRPARAERCAEGIAAAGLDDLLHRWIRGVTARSRRSCWAAPG